MTILYEAKKYSRGKLTIMGVSTLMIAWFHSNVNVPQGSLIWFTKWFGDMGVDMFLLASGMGVYMSLEKTAISGDLCADVCGVSCRYFSLLRFPDFFGWNSVMAVTGIWGWRC